MLLTRLDRRFRWNQRHGRYHRCGRCCHGQHGHAGNAVGSCRNHHLACTDPCRQAIRINCRHHLVRTRPGKLHIRNRHSICRRGHGFELLRLAFLDRRLGWTDRHGRYHRRWRRRWRRRRSCNGESSRTRNTFRHRGNHHFTFTGSTRQPVRINRRYHLV